MLRFCIPFGNGSRIQFKLSKGICMRRLVVFLLFISTILANPRIRGYHSILLNEALTASFSSQYDYDVIENPLQVIVSFSQDVSIFDSHDCVLVNAKVKTISKLSSSTYQIIIIPEKPGYLSISLSRSIQSITSKSLINPPSIEFNYLGVAILSTHVTTITPTSVSISISSSKPIQLWSLIVKSSIKAIPSERTIMTEGQSSSSFSSSTILLHTNLEENTEYIIYYTGQEETGSLIGNDISLTRITIKTRMKNEEDISSKSDGSLCESGLTISSITKKLELAPCSNHGYCRQSQCICIGSYSGNSCNKISEVKLDYTNNTHQLIHVSLQLTGEFKEQTKMEEYWKVSLREIISNRLSLSPELIQIRHWNYLQTSLASLSVEGKHHLVSQHQRTLSQSNDIVLSVYLTIVTDHNMLLVVTKRLNEMIAENDLKEGMAGKLVTIRNAAILSMFEQINEDKWSCYDRLKNEDETDVDCGGSCMNGCTLQKHCLVGNDCVDGLYCTKGKCIDRNWKEVIITTIVIVGIIVVMIITIIVGGIIYQKVKENRKCIVCLTKNQLYHNNMI